MKKQKEAITTRLNGIELRELLQEAVAKDRDLVKEILGEVLQKFLEMERDNQIVGDKHKRDNKKRFETRNGVEDN